MTKISYRDGNSDITVVFMLIYTNHRDRKKLKKLVYAKT